MTCSPPSSSAHGIFQARILECVARWQIALASTRLSLTQGPRWISWPPPPLSSSPSTSPSTWTTLQRTWRTSPTTCSAVSLMTLCWTRRALSWTWNWTPPRRASKLSTATPWVVTRRLRAPPCPSRWRTPPKVRRGGRAQDPRPRGAAHSHLSRETILCVSALPQVQPRRALVKRLFHWLDVQRGRSQTGSNTWELIGKAGSRVPPRPARSETLWGGSSLPGDSDWCLGPRTSLRWNSWGVGVGRIKQ